jgi:hypothetical protein
MDYVPIPTLSPKIELNFGFTKKDRAAVPAVPHADTPLLTVDTPPANPRALLPCRGDEALSGDPLYTKSISPSAKGGTPQPLVLVVEDDAARAAIVDVKPALPLSLHHQIRMLTLKASIGGQ